MKTPLLPCFATTLLLLGCGGGGSGPVGELPQGPVVEVFANPYDSRLLRSVDEQGREFVYHGRKDGNGVAIALDRVVVQSPGSGAVEVGLDPDGRPVRFLTADGQGIRLDWLDGLLWLRFHDEGGAVTEEAWMDRNTFLQVPRPTASALAIQSARPAMSPVLDAVSYGLVADQPLAVTVQLASCGMAQSPAIADIEKCEIEFVSAVGSAAFPATRDGDVFRANLPRNITPYEWRTDQCEALVRQLGRLCDLSDDAPSGDMLVQACSSLILRGPSAPLLCALASLSANLFCSNVAIWSDRICSAAVVVQDPFHGYWTVPGERSIRAVAYLRTCQGLSRRVSEVRTLTNEDQSATLSVDACVPDPSLDWNVMASAVPAGYVVSTASSGNRVFRIADASAGLVAVGADIPILSHSYVSAWLWPNTSNPLFRIETQPSASLQVHAGPNGADYQVTASVDRTRVQLRQPTAFEVAAGYMDASISDMTEPVRLASGFTGQQVVRLRPFQRVVLQASMASSGGATITHELEVTQIGFLGGPAMTHTVQGNGSVSLVVTHDQLRMYVEDQMAAAGFPPGSLGGFDPVTQCYYVAFVVVAESELDTQDADDASMTTQASYTVRVEPY